MDIRIKATDYEMTPDIESYLNQRLEALEKYIGENVELARCEVELGRDAGRPRHGKNIYFAEMRVISPGENDVYARNNSESVNGAIDDLRKSGAMLKRLMRFGRE